MTGRPPPPREEALATVLAYALGSEARAALADASGERRLAPWSATPHRALARHALRAPEVWDRCATLVDEALGPPPPWLAARSAEDLTRLAAGHADLLPARELCALLWWLLRSGAPIDGRMRTGAGEDRGG